MSFYLTQTITIWNEIFCACYSIAITKLNVDILFFLSLKVYLSSLDFFHLYNRFNFFYIISTFLVKANEGSDDKESKGKEEEKDVEAPAMKKTIMVELLNLARPFTALRALDMDALASKIIKSLK